MAILQKTNVPVDVVLSEIDLAGSMNGFGFKFDAPMTATKICAERTSPVRRSTITGTVSPAGLAHRNRELAFPASVQLAEAGVAIALRIALNVLVPEDRQRGSTTTALGAVASPEGQAGAADVPNYYHDVPLLSAVECAAPVPEEFAGAAVQRTGRPILVAFKSGQFAGHRPVDFAVILVETLGIVWASCRER
jgi:hypothetical protein